MILQTIRRDVDNVLINIDPSNVFLYMFFPGRFHQYCQTASDINGLRPWVRSRGSRGSACEKFCLSAAYRWYR